MHRLYCLVIALGVAANLHTSPAAAEQPADPADCATIEADAARLACYDLLIRQTAPANRPEAQPAAQPAAQPVAQTAAQPAPAETKTEAEGKFGLTLRALLGSSQLEQVTSRITGISKHKTGRVILILENGQHWLPIETADLSYFRSGDQITIRRASMGSFLAKKDDLNRTVRVRRID